MRCQGAVLLAKLIIWCYAFMLNGSGRDHFYICARDDLFLYAGSFSCLDSVAKRFVYVLCYIGASVSFGLHAGSRLHTGYDSRCMVLTIVLVVRIMWVVVR